jgi:metal-responsive CopG/Arc/MetJ family transcriptional regulator
MGKRESEKPILNFVVDRELLERLDEFRFENRFDSRAQAVKWLLDYALAQKPYPRN